MVSLKHLQFSKKVPGTKWMKKLIQLCRFIDLHFMVHESKVEGVCSVGKKMCLQIKLEMDESAIHCLFFMSVLLQHHWWPSPKNLASIGDNCPNCRFFSRQPSIFLVIFFKFLLKNGQKNLRTIVSSCFFHCFERNSQPKKILEQWKQSFDQHCNNKYGKWEMHTRTPLIDYKELSLMKSCDASCKANNYRFHMIPPMKLKRL
jgi:hypothetical protein